MDKVTFIGVDLAKSVFQLHGAAADGTSVFRKKLSRPQFRRFIAKHPPCCVAMGAGRRARRRIIGAVSWRRSDTRSG